jgi:hypothetical protein
MNDANRIFNKVLSVCASGAKQIRSSCTGNTCTGSTGVGLGKSKLTTQANNFFGIKADSSWKGDSYLGSTEFETVLK